MELIEIVKSYIIFLILGLIILIISVFVFFKFRNRAKKEKNLSLKHDQLNFVNLSSDSKQDLSTTSIKKDREKQISELSYKKFEVINDKVETSAIKNIHINYHSNVYKYYEEFDSKMMFKLKVEMGKQP